MSYVNKVDVFPLEKKDDWERHISDKVLLRLTKKRIEKNMYSLLLIFIYVNDIDEKEKKLEPLYKKAMVKWEWKTEFSGWPS